VKRIGKNLSIIPSIFISFYFSEAVYLGIIAYQSRVLTIRYSRTINLYNTMC